MKKRTLFLLPAIFFLCSCGPAKKIQTTIPAKDTMAVVMPVVIPPVISKTDSLEDSAAFIRETYKQVLKNHINFTTFSAKVDVDYKDAEGKEFTATAHLRMYKDSVIWISVTGPLGIEGLRAYITVDSVQVLDKQNKVYIDRSVSYLRDAIALPLDLRSLQDLLIGNPVFLDSIISFRRLPNSISLLSKGEFFMNSFTVDQASKLIQNSRLDDLGENQNRSCYLVYEDYENKDGINFPEKRTINVVEKKKLDIKLGFRQFAFNETLSFPFTVPKNYKTESDQ